MSKQPPHATDSSFLALHRSSYATAIRPEALATADLCRCWEPCLNGGRWQVLIEAADGRHGVRLYALYVGGLSLATITALTLHRTIKADEAATLAASPFCTMRGTA
jgi:hypothetical protein